MSQLFETQSSTGMFLQRNDVAPNLAQYSLLALTCVPGLDERVARWNDDDWALLWDSLKEEADNIQLMRSLGL